MKGSNGSGNTKKDCKSREKAGKRRVAAGANIFLLAQKVEVLEKMVFESQRSQEALRANQAIFKNLTLRKLSCDFCAESSAS